MEVDTIGDGPFNVCLSYPDVISVSALKAPIPEERTLRYVIIPFLRGPTV